MRVAVVSLALLSAVVQVSAGQQADTVPHRLAPITVQVERQHAPPPPVSTIDVPGTVLRRTPATNPYDLVRRTAGIEIHEQGQGPGFASDAVIRGFTSDHSSDVLFVLDGVPLNLPVHGHTEGYADWSVIPAIALSSLRVIHGPASPLYGDFALGGVVEAFTSPDASETIGTIGGSSFGDAEAALRTGLHRPGGGLLVAGVFKRDNGWRDNSDYRLGTGIVRGWRGLGTSRLEGGIVGYSSTFNSPGFVPVARFNAGDLEPATDPSDGGSAHRLIGTLRFLTNAASSTQFEFSGWTQLVGSTVFLNIPHDGVVQQSDEEDDRVSFGGQAQLVARSGTHQFLVGVSGRFDDTHYDLYDTQDRVRQGQTTDVDARHHSVSTYGRWRTLLGSHLVVDLGGRFDRLEYRSRDNLAGGGWRSGGSSQWSPKLGARYLLGSRTTLLASVSRGFRGAPGTVNDPARDPMVAWSKEFGVRFDDQDVVVQLALFRLDVSNERIMDPVTREISGSGTSRRQGINAEVEWALSPAIRLSFEGTLNDAEITGTHSAPTPAIGRLFWPLIRAQHDEPLSPGDKVPGVAQYLGRVGLDGALSSRFGHHLAVRFSGPFTPIGEPTIRTQPYVVADIGASLRLPSLRGELRMTLQNVFDSRYPEIRASGFINPGSPRALRLALYLGGSSAE